MPLMRPPHYQGLFYDGRRIARDELVQVADRDVEALEAEQWVRALEATPAEPEPEPEPAPTFATDRTEAEED